MNDGFLRQIVRERVEAAEQGQRKTIEIVGRRLAWSAILEGGERVEDSEAIGHVRRLVGWAVGWMLDQGHTLGEYANEDGFAAIEAIFMVAASARRSHGRCPYSEGLPRCGFVGTPGMRLFTDALGQAEALTWGRVAAAAENEVRSCLNEKARRFQRTCIVYGFPGRPKSAYNWEPSMQADVADFRTMAGVTPLAIHCSCKCGHAILYARTDDALWVRPVRQPQHWPITIKIDSAALFAAYVRDSDLAVKYADAHVAGEWANVRSVLTAAMPEWASAEGS